MGLGKTIEIIDLILLHPRPAREDTDSISEDKTQLPESKATIIITPPTIRIFPIVQTNCISVSQWAGEFADRAPSLKVFVYPGVQHLPADFENNNLLDYDVILATYPVLSKELHFATPPPNRSMRYKKIHQSRRSPLVEFQWWRVCLDEAQMIEGSVTSAALVASMIPRCVSLLLLYT
jgi:E3 ubiquitin-protein ligase SHPRH